MLDALKPIIKNLKPQKLQAQYEISRLLATLSAEVGSSYVEWLKRVAVSPKALARNGVILAADSLEISSVALKRLMKHRLDSNGDVPTVDRRFKAEAWQKYVIGEIVLRGYAAGSSAILRLIDETEGLDSEDRRKVRFYTTQFLDAIAPANYPMMNPEVIETTVDAKGRNLLSGLKNLWDDLDFKHGRLNISMSDLGAFEVGRDLAITPGEVVYQNDLIQLIQYTPSTPKVAKRPMLVIPPWFNKYYVLDMQPKNSLIKYLVDQGQTVFLISWRNPDGVMPDKALDDYLTEGPLTAIDVIEAITGEKEVNATGYCLGGILLACTLAWLKAKGQSRIRTGTYLTTLIDYTDVGDVKVFVNDAIIDRLETIGKVLGYLPGDNVAWGFRLLRAPDLVWSFVINHYLLGRPRMPFDLLYWNEDATNMPVAAHTFFMRKMYMENLLREPGGVEMAGVPMDMTQVDAPAYILSTRDDHIAPWKTTYETTQLFSGDTRFVLGNSGHIAGVINPPTKTKYGYRVGESTPADPDKWFDAATENPGSWWPDWVQWLEGHSGGQVPARTPGSDHYPSLEPAPGAYVKQRIRFDDPPPPVRDVTHPRDIEVAAPAKKASAPAKKAASKKAASKKAASKKAPAKKKKSAKASSAGKKEGRANGTRPVA